MAESKALYVLLAPLGQLSGNGQLRETVRERRNRQGKDVPFWYLSPELLENFDIPGEGLEAVVAEDLTAINWVKLRFGGERCQFKLDIEKLRDLAGDLLPPAPTIKDISA